MNIDNDINLGLDIKGIQIFYEKYLKKLVIIKINLFIFISLKMYLLYSFLL